MRKIFIGECIVIAALLIVIGSLLKTDNTKVWGMEAKESILTAGEETEPTVEEGGLIQYARDLLGVMEDAGSDNSWNNGSVSGNTVSGNTVSGNGVSGNTTVASDLQDGVRRIAVFADSIWNAGRGVDSVADHLVSQIGGVVYNGSIGGTSAAIIHGDSTNVLSNWKSQSLNGMMYVARGELSAEALLTGSEAYEDMKAADFSTVDYLVIAYGLNDFFSGVRIYPEDMYDMTTYVGGLRHAIAKMQETYPGMKIIVIGPTYSEARTELSVGNLVDYSHAAGAVAAESGAYFLDMYHGLGIDASNKDQYLEDGVHLNAEGRQLYAQRVAQLIREIEAQ